MSYELSAISYQMLYAPLMNFDTSIPPIMARAMLPGLMGLGSVITLMHTGTSALKASSSAGGCHPLFHEEPFPAQRFDRLVVIDHADLRALLEEAAEFDFLGMAIIPHCCRCRSPSPREAFSESPSQTP